MSVTKLKQIKMTDPISDFLTRVRNAALAGHKVVEIPASKMKLELTRILHEKGYIISYKLVEGTPFNTIKIALKYHPDSKKSAIKKITRVSSPGLRQYVGVDEMPRVLNGLGIAIISTSKGVITDKEAKELNVGGEVICYVY
jgi:small subunit ribosomal protein S8